MMSIYQKTDVNVIAIENSSYSNTALDDEGRVWTWGNGGTEYRLGRAVSTANPYNRGGQVTETIYPGVNLPFVLQISAAQNTVLALDRDGNVWSWGINADGGASLGRDGGNTRPGKVKFPDGIKIKWIGAAYQGGKAVDTNGGLWTWGTGTRQMLGTGNNTDVKYPVQLTLDENNQALPNNFKMVTATNYFDDTAAMAITEDGKIYTWGNNGTASKGGSSRPKYVITNASIKKIDVSNGTYGFLTNDGELWTWGDNQGVGPGRQGHGDTVERILPKRVENVRMTNSASSQIPAPKFKDVSLYGWSMCAVDFAGNIYGAGQDYNNKHGALVNTNILTKYAPPGLPADTKIFIVSEGYTSTSYVDIYGNAYVTGATGAQGNNTNDGSPAGPWVHFTGSGKKPMFTVLESSPTSEAKRYNTTPKTTLKVETNIAADEIKYVIIFPDDTSAYTDGETFYSKSFAELELPYYLKGTDPQLLLSPNYDLWESRYYANPKISEDVFNAAYDMKSSSEKGMMNLVSGSGNKAFTAADLVSHNSIVWVQSKNSFGTTRAIYRFDNYYTQTKVWFEGIKLVGPAFNLYPPELVGGGYGLFLDRHGSLIPGVPPFGYDIVQPMPKALDYWMLSPANQTDLDAADDDGYTHRVDTTKEVFLTELSQKGDEATKTPRVTFTYEKNPDMWVDADLYFVTETGIPVDVKIGEAITDREQRFQFAPKDAEYVDGQDPYLPPEANDSITKVVGYKLGTKPDNTGEDYTPCDFPSGFKPNLTEKTDIYIVYTTGMISVTETFIDISDGVEKVLKNNDGLESVVKNFKQVVDTYTARGPGINNYVIVGHEIIIDGNSEGVEDYPWEDDHYEQKSAIIDNIPGESIVRFLYKADKNGNNIPDDEEGCAQFHWIAVNANNTAVIITEKSFVGNGAQGANITVFEDKVNVLPTALYNPAQWRFRPSLPGDTAPYLPKGSDGAETIIFSAGTTQDVYFYYDENYNENNVADKDEGWFTEKYKIVLSETDLTPPKADTASKWLGGQTYAKQAPLIADYVAVGYRIVGGGSNVDYLERIDRDKTGDVSVVYEIPFLNTKKDYTVTFLYKEDKNNNNIPDDEEGSVTVSWLGTTYGGNTVELAKLVIVGYIDDVVTNMIYPPNHIDEVWKLVSSDVPDSVKLTATPQHFEYRYEEVPEFATIMVESSSTDGNLDFFYQYTKKLTDEAFNVTAFAIPTYRVSGFTLYDNYGTEIATGSGDTVHIDPSTGSQRIVFTYESTITTVVIRAVEADDYTNVLHSQTITDAVIGQKYAATAPYVDDTWVLMGNILQVIDVAQGTNHIIFEYEKATGNVTVLLKETDENGAIIRVLSETVDHGYTKSIEIPGLTDAYYTALSTTEQVVDFNGAEPVPQIVTYYYSKDMMDVLIRATDDADDTVLKTETYTAAARMGESYLAIAPNVTWYTLAESNSKSVYANPDAPLGTITVDFAYKKDSIGTIFVKSFYKDADNTEVELQTYTAKSLVGNKFTAVAGSFAGFELADASADTAELIVNADENKNSIEFEYTDLRKTVGVFTQLEDDETTRKKISATKYVSGSETSIIPPYMNNHLVVGYIIDTDAMVNVAPETFTDLVLAGSTAIADDMSIVFVYAPIEEIVDDRFIDVTIKGITGAITHYSHVKRITKSALPLTLAAPADVFAVPGHALDSAADFEVTEGTTEKTFNYYSLATTVTIRMVDGSGNDVAESFAVSATAGAPFTYNAPNVPEHYLAGNSLGLANPVLADGASEIVFTYEKITSMVTLIAKEDNANGRIIGVFEVATPSIGTATYNVPDLTADYYTANQQNVEITFDGTNSVSAEAYYTKDLVSVEIEAAHYITNADLGQQTPLINQRKGEAVTVSAPSIANYVLVDNATQIVIADGSTKAVFKYRPLEEDEVSVKALDTEGNILQSYILTGSVGESVQAYPPAILGWKTSDIAKSAVIGTDSEIVFNYTKNVVTITVNRVDSEGNALGSTNVEAAKGGSYTAYAPHMPGYVIYGSSFYALTNLAADATVTFVYQPVENAVATVTIIGNSAEGELYSYSIIRPKNSGFYNVEARDVDEYRLISTSPASVEIKEADKTVTFEYESIYTTVTVYMIDEDTTDFLAVFYNRAETGESYTFNAPNIADYDLTSDSAIGSVAMVLPNGASEITFTYKRTAI